MRRVALFAGSIKGIFWTSNITEKINVIIQQEVLISFSNCRGRKGSRWRNYLFGIRFCVLFASFVSFLPRLRFGLTVAHEQAVFVGISSSYSKFLNNYTVIQWREWQVHSGGSCWWCNLNTACFWIVLQNLKLMVGLKFRLILNIIISKQNAARIYIWSFVK